MLPKLYWRNNLKFLISLSAETQTDIGLQLNKSQKTISNWINGAGEPSYDVLVQLCHILGITLEDFLLKDLTNAPVIEKQLEKNEDKNAQVNAQVNAPANAKKDPKEGVAEEMNDLPGKSGIEYAKYIELLEKYNSVLEGKLIEHEFRYRIADIDARVRALQELVINENLQDLPLPSQKEAFFHKKKQDMILQSGILSGEST